MDGVPRADSCGECSVCSYKLMLFYHVCSVCSYTLRLQYDLTNRSLIKIGTFYASHLPAIVRALIQPSTLAGLRFATAALPRVSS